MRFALLLASLGLLSTGCTAHAHAPAKVTPGPTIEVTLGWTWVDAHWTRGHHVKGHWRHPHYGKSHRQFAHGPPAARPNSHAVWVPGHWQGRGHHRHWVSGRWR